MRKSNFEDPVKNQINFYEISIKGDTHTVRYAICLGGFVTFVYNIPTRTKAAEIHPNSTNQNSVRNQNKPIRSVSNQTKQNSQ